MGMRRFTDLQTILDAKAATGVGNIIDVSDWEHLMVMVGTDSSANLTIKCQGSILDTAPDFSKASSTTNHWEYIDMIDCQDHASIDGDTGVSFAGSDDYRLFEVNVSGLHWLTFVVTARSAGNVTVKVKCFE